MYLALGDYTKAAEAYRMNLKNRPGRFNSIYGAALAAKKGGDNTNAKTYFEALLKLAPSENRSRPALKEAEDFLRSI
jgi:tetratricopeptide (TPR) repeat protein